MVRVGARVRVGVRVRVMDRVRVRVRVQVGECLAGAGLGEADHVDALHRHGPALPLDCRRCTEADLEHGQSRGQVSGSGSRVKVKGQG